MSLAPTPAVLIAIGLALAACGNSQRSVSTDAGAGAAGDVPPNRFACQDPRPVAGGGGYVECQGGWFARPSAAACTVTGIRELGTGCRRDSDCNAGRICACLNGTAPGTCLEADCTTDGDCARGFHCASGIIGRSDSAFWRFQCQRPDDACVRDNDCPPIDGGTARLYACQSQPAGRRCE